MDRKEELVYSDRTNYNTLILGVESLYRKLSNTELETETETETIPDFKAYLTPNPHSERNLCRRSMSMACFVVGGGRKSTMIVTTERRKKNKNKNRIAAAAAAEIEKEEEVVHQEPLLFLGSDIMLMILNHLDAKGIALCLGVSHGWHALASSNTLWTSRCQELLLGKAHIPQVSQVQRISRLAAYSLSVMDGRRTRIVKEDLCDHAWEFRFMKDAPDYWLNLDPSWTGTGPPMKRYFHPDGTLSADPGDPVWGAHQCTYSIVTSYVGDGTIREHYVRINRWPPMTMTRKLDWSWEMSNGLVLFSSIPDANKDGGTGPLFPVW